MILWLEGTTVAIGPIFIAVDSIENFYGAAVLSDVAWAALAPLYLAFLGAALHVPLTRPFRTRAARVVLVLLSLASAALVVFAPKLFIDHIEGQDPYGGGTWVYQAGWGETIATLVILGVALYGLAAAIWAYRRAPRGEFARVRARAFLLAFGLRDVFYIVLFSAIWYFNGIGPPDASDPAFSDPTRIVATLLVIYVILLGYVSSLAYGLLKGQLLDVDVKIKWTIRRGSVAAVFLAVFFVVAQIAQNWLSTQYGYLMGGLVAGVLLFAIAPIQNAAERLADRAMPHARPAAQMAEAEKLGLFREMAASAWADGTLTREERRLLAQLREKLGIPAEEAERVERELTGADA